MVNAVIIDSACIIVRRSLPVDALGLLEVVFLASAPAVDVVHPCT